MNQVWDDIVITGAGAVGPMGLDKETLWTAVASGRVGLGPVPALDGAHPGAAGGQAPALPGHDESHEPREAAYLRVAIVSALREAGVDGVLPYAPERCGVMLGTTLHGMRRAGRFLRSGDLKDLGQFTAADIVRLATAGLPLAGWAGTTSSACSSGLGSILLGITMLQAGELDLVVAGGYDPISEYTYAGFSSLRLVAPGTPLPFCKGRQGMNVSEGYGLVILERAGAAAGRGARPLARIAGWGEGSDAFHLTKPHPQGQGAARTMRQALDRAGVKPGQIGLIGAHATATSDNDNAELAAMRDVFGAALASTPVVALKGQLGHTLGAAGSLELILALMAMREQCLPATPHLAGQDLESPDLQLFRPVKQQAAISFTLNTSLGFGGANTCVVLGPTRPAPAKQPATLNVSGIGDRDACITGVGVVMPGLIGNDRFAQHVDAPGQPPLSGDTGDIAEEELLPLLQDARRVRRISQYVKLTLAATAAACRHAGLGESATAGQGWTALLGTAHGSVAYCEAYYRQIVAEGIAAANPMLFAEGVSNAAAAHLSMMLSIQNSCQTLIGSRTAGLDALRLATMRIHNGEWDRVIVSAADEYAGLVNQAYGQCDPAYQTRMGIHFGDYPSAVAGFATGAGAVTLVLESRASARQRRATPLGTVRATAAARVPQDGGLDAVDLATGVLKRLGNPAAVLSSANGMSRDRLELAALRHAGRNGAPCTVSAIYGHVAECFSAMPLAALAAVLLRGRMPALRGTLSEKAGDLQAATGQESVSDVAVLCTDHAGTISAVRITAGAANDL